MNITIRNFPSYTSAFFYGKLTQAVLEQNWHGCTHCLIKMSKNPRLSLANDSGIEFSLVASGVPDPDSEDLYMWITVDGNEKIDVEFRQYLIFPGERR